MEKYLDVSEVAQRLRVSLKTVDAWQKLGKLPKPRKLGRKRLWPESVIENLLAGNVEGRS